MAIVTLAATQMSCSWDPKENLEKAEALIRRAAGLGADIILPQELFETRYFCQHENADYYAYAAPLEENAAVRRFGPLAKELGVVLPVPFFERAGNVYFNSTAVFDADGSLLGVYRKTHIPDGAGYMEKFYFAPGDTGFKVFSTRFGGIGVGICWDQWFPEAARCMALLGAEILFYPTAIGSEPVTHIDSQPHWRRCIQGHAAANILPVCVSNRVGEEEDLTFYGSSFIAGPTGELLAEAGREGECVLTAAVDLDEAARLRREWGVFRDRRPEMYGPLLRMDASC